MCCSDLLCNTCSLCFDNQVVVRKPGEERPDEEEDDKSKPPKEDRFHKSHKKKTQVVDEVETGIPKLLAPVKPIIEAKNVEVTKEWDQVAVGKGGETLWDVVRKRWSWVKGVPDFPKVQDLTFLKFLEQDNPDTEVLALAKSELEKLRKSVTTTISQATEHLHKADLGMRALDALNGGPVMSRTDQEALMVCSRVESMKAEALLTSPARKVAAIIQDKTNLPVLNDLLLSE